ncbi:MAG TPA: cobalamin-dependent protein [Thermoanaerobaculia bacterium]|nr:cobalamin-dependent protein [Thermoanaerobaculia bacterium]
MAEAVTAEFFQRHPDWADRYGERGFELGVQDARFHLGFLAGALAGGDPEAFGEYVGWTRRVLEARGISSPFLRENLEQIEAALLAALPAEDQESLRAAFQAGYRVLNRAAGGESGQAAPAEAGAVSRVYLQAILKGDRQAALGVAREALREMESLPRLYLEVIEPAQHEVGRLWETNVITVAEEHMATAVTQFVMAQCFPLLERTSPCHGKMVLTGVEEELHQVGANMVADVLESFGWDVRFLGTNLPHKGILQVIREHQPDWVGISATTLLSLPRVSRLIAEIRTTFPENPPRVVVGGSAFRFSPQAWREVGADAVGTNLQEAIALLCGDAEPPGSSP